MPGDPLLPEGVRSTTVALDDVELHVLEAGDEGPLVVLTHGFPELAFSWRHQLRPIADAGYRVVAPDMRGYGRSSRPEALDAYGIHQLTGDLVGLLDHYGDERAVFVGHDWGAIVTWHMPLLHEDRVDGVVCLSVPYTRRSQIPPMQRLRELLGDSFFYMLYFQEPDLADADMGADAATTMRRMLCGVKTSDGAPDSSLMAANDGRGFVERMPEPDGLPDWLSQAELDHYAAEFTRTGFTGGINWYRNMDANWAATPELAGATVSVPTAYIGGGRDPVAIMSPPERQVVDLHDFRGMTIVPDAGHWVQQEAPDPVNDAILDFLAEVRPPEA